MGRHPALGWAVHVAGDGDDLDAMDLSQPKILIDVEGLATDPLDRCPCFATSAPAILREGLTDVPLHPNCDPPVTPAGPVVAYAGADGCVPSYSRAARVGR